jgi:hypothetical protein
MKKQSVQIFFLIVCISLLFFSCHRVSDKPVNNWTENQKRQYFQDSIAFRYGWGTVNSKGNLNDFSVFMDSMYPESRAKNKYNPFVYAFEEPYIDTTNIDPSKYWIRIIIDPCWRIPVCITLEKRNKLSYLSTKITNGQGGYYTGLLLLTITKVFPDTLYDNISLKLNSLNYWNQQEEPDPCLDGETWYFEGVEKGHYNYFMRRCLGSNEKDGSRRQLYAIGCYLLGLGKIFNEHYIEAMPWEEDFRSLKSLVDTNAFKIKMIGGV